MPPQVENKLGASQGTGAVTGLEQTLRDRNIAIIGNTLHFESTSPRSHHYPMMTDQPALALGLHDLDGTTVFPTNIIEAIGAEAIFYHVWAAVKQSIDERYVQSVEQVRCLTTARQCQPPYPK